MRIGKGWSGRRILTLPIVRRMRGWQLRRLTPLHAGAAKGTSIVRYYQDDFLARYRADIRGRCLEIGETSTVRRYGGDAVTEAEAMDLAAHGDDVTVVADLSRADHVASDRYDCFINQFTMTVVYDVEAALYHAIRILKPGGVLLINFGCVDYYLHRGLDMGTGAPLYMYNWFTPLQVRETFGRLGISEADVELQVYGNLMSRIAFQVNLSAEELTQRERDTVDPGQPLLICARVQKPESWQARKPEYREPTCIPPGPPASLRADTGHYGDAYR